MSQKFLNILTLSLSPNENSLKSLLKAWEEIININPPIQDCCQYGQASIKLGWLFAFTLHSIVVLLEMLVTVRFSMKVALLYPSEEFSPVPTKVRVSLKSARPE
jgi:hypothetical protein